MNNIAIYTGGAPWGAAALYTNLQMSPGQLSLIPQLMEASTEVRIARSEVVRSARHVERTSAHVMSSVDRKSDMVTGSWLRVSPKPDWELLGIEGDEELKKRFVAQCRRAFHHWGYGSRNLCDAEGHSNFGGLMWLAFRNVTGPDGETAGVIHYEPERRKAYATPWATFVTVLDPQRVASPPEAGLNDRIFEGREMDRHGRWIALHVRAAALDDAAKTFDQRFKRIARETYWGRPMAWHWFIKRRGQQHRGLSALATVVNPTLKLDRFDNATLGAAVLDEVISTYVKTESSAETIGEALSPGVEGPGWEGEFGAKISAYGKMRLSIGGQRIPVLLPGDEIKMNSARRAAVDPTPFRNGYLRQAALATGVTFEQASGNYSDANYSAARAARIDVWDGVISNRQQFVAGVATPIYGAVIEEAIEIGAVTWPPHWPPFQENREAYIGCSWNGPGMGQIDPLKEANARTARLASKTTTWEKECAADGEDWEDVFRQHAREHALADELGLVLDNDHAPVAESPSGSDGGDGESTPKRRPPSSVPGDGDGDATPNEEGDQ